MARRIATVFALLLLFAFGGEEVCAAAGQAGGQIASGPAAAAAVDPVMRVAENLVGRALLLRGFAGANHLTYDASGKLLGETDTTDWTLAGVNVLKAARPAPDRLELEGVRVAIRYNPDAHEFQRHPINEEKMRLSIQLEPNADVEVGRRRLEAALAAIFSIGIDPALQRAMPPLWRHYFDASAAWSPDALASETIYPIPPLPPLPGPSTEIVPPILSHQAASQFTPSARKDRVQGTVQLRLVVDDTGTPQRIMVTRPLGYGLDQQAADAVAKWRFNPALHGGKAVSAAILVNIDFVPPPPQR